MPTERFIWNFEGESKSVSLRHRRRSQMWLLVDFSSWSSSHWQGGTVTCCWFYKLSYYMVLLNGFIFLHKITALRYTGLFINASASISFSWGLENLLAMLLAYFTLCFQLSWTFHDDEFSEIYLIIGLSITFIFLYCSLNIFILLVCIPNQSIFIQLEIVILSLLSVCILSVNHSKNVIWRKRIFYHD